MMIGNIARAGASKWGLPLRQTDVVEAAGRERRQTERAVDYWREKVEAHGDNATIGALDLDKVDTIDWSNRFVVAVDRRVESSALLMYGAEFARLLGLPPKARTNLALARQLPRRFSDLFLRGCAEAPKQVEPVLVEGAVERGDRRIEQYRAVFIPVKVRPGALTHFVFGAFNSRIVEPAMA